MKAAQIDRAAFSAGVQHAPVARRVAGARRPMRVSAVAEVQDRVQPRAKVSQ